MGTSIGQADGMKVFKAAYTALSVADVAGIVGISGAQYLIN
jgi:hypothetical protein